MKNLGEYLFIKQASEYNYYVLDNMVIVDDDWFWSFYRNPNFNIEEWIYNTTGCEYLISFQREDKSIDVSKWSDISGYHLYCTPDEIKSLMRTTRKNKNKHYMVSRLFTGQLLYQPNL